MKIITVSRQFGSGGRELGKRLARSMGFDYYDSEIISAVAKKSGIDPDYVEKTLSDHGWENYKISYRGTLSSTEYVNASKINLLLIQKQVIESIATLGHDFVIVGRNADIILRDYDPLNIFVCASTASKVARCKERASEDENYTEKQLIRKMKNIDRIRARTREIVGGSLWGDCEAYHMTVNTSDREIKDIVPSVVAFAECWFGGKNEY